MEPAAPVEAVPPTEEPEVKAEKPRREERPERRRREEPRREEPKAEAAPERPRREEPPIRPVRGVSKVEPRDDDDRRVVGFGGDTPAFLMRATPKVPATAED
jgi:hypothetical protein